MSEALATVRELLGEVADLRRAADVLEWDERVCMPPGGASAHGEMQATLRRRAHEAFTSPAMGAAIEAAKETVADADERTRRLIAVTERDFTRAIRVPASFVAAHATATSAAQQAWGDARAASDFAAFAPHLQRIVDLKRQYVGFFPPAAHAYDVLLDEYEPGLKTSEVQALFAALRPRQVELLHAIAARPQVDDAFLRGDCDEAAMWRFSTEVATAFGFDWSRGRQDKSIHPFATAFGADDVRITSRWLPAYPLSLLFGTMHETGHALYEQGVDPAHHRTPLEGGASLGIHESQSRLWENLVGRSRPFWQHMLPRVQAAYPGPLDGITLDRFYRGINRVERSLIRIEADEATYNLHIMLRVELEIALVEGTVSVGDLPALWRLHMQEYLGVMPPDDAHGVLQDIHWSAGLFGYFATYTVGNVVAVQLWETFGCAHPSRDADMARGDFSALREWLRVHIHQYGRMYEPRELVRRVTGGAIDPEPYLRYIEAKYRAIYEG